MARARNIAASVLAIARGSLGPFVVALAGLRQIRSAHPAARITLLTTPPFEALSRACPHIDAVDIDGEPEDFGDWTDLVGRLRGGRFDRVYDLECSAWSNRLFQLLRPFPPVWSGIALGCALPHRARDGVAMHPLERQAEQLACAGIWPEAPTRPGAAPPPDVSWIARRLLDPRRQPRPVVLLVPGETTTPAERRWPPAAYGELGHALRRQGYDLVILGGPEESALAHAIQRRAEARDLTGRPDFAQVAALGARAALAIGADTALMQLVAAAGAPCLLLAASDCDPDRTAARGHIALLYAETLESLPVEEVLRAAARLTPPIQKTM